jgi:hypothetical protein
MTTFDTPAPILVTLEIGVGDIRIEASERSDTVVEVRPSDGAKPADVTAAEQTPVEFDNGILVIKAPKRWRQWTPRGGGDSIEVHIDLPEGSQVRGEAGIAAFRCTGRLGQCDLKTGIGEIRLEEAGPVQLSTGVGDLTVDHLVGRAELTTRSGALHVGSIDGTAVAKNSNGDTWIGDITGDLRVNAANGKIAVDRAHSAVVAKTANGDIRVGDVARGAVVAQTARGQVDIGIRQGVPAWLDLNTRFGVVENDLDAVERPQPGEDAVEVRARTAFGDITVRRTPENDMARRAS